MTEIDFSEDSMQFSDVFKDAILNHVFDKHGERDFRPKNVPIHALNCSCIEGGTV